ncbi:MAG: CHAT domain-containing protein [Cyanobacteria bacterium J06598_1]
MPAVLTPAISAAIDGTGTLVTPQSMDGAGTQFNITEGSLSADRVNLFHSFDAFSVEAGDRANFITDPTVQNVLVRVEGSAASIIDGQLAVSGLGQPDLFLMNPAGILVGPEAMINLPASLTLTTADEISFEQGAFGAASDSVYSALTGDPTGEFGFNQPQSGPILNEGTISVGPAASISLIGGTVSHSGELSAPGGNITVAAVPGESTVRLSQPKSLLSLEITPREDSLPSAALLFSPIELPALLTHSEQTHANLLSVAPDGTVSLQTATPGSAMVSGSITASSITTSSITASSEQVANNVEYAATNGLTGGNIAILGEQVSVAEADLSANGERGGGNIYIGGDYQGRDRFPTAQETWVSAAANISANAQLAGDGGEVIVWADDTTQYLGDISATGGRVFGNGGFVEVSGKETLQFQGTVDVSAAAGEVGSLLLDPEEIVIVDALSAPHDGQLSDYEILVDDASGVLRISTTLLESLSEQANITLEATHHITLEDLADDELNFSAAVGDITLTADADNNGAGGLIFRDRKDTIVAPGRSLSLSGRYLFLGGLNTSDPNGGGDITLNATASIRAGDLNTHAAEGTSGSVTLLANNDITIQSIQALAPVQPDLTQSGLTQSGLVEATSQVGNITIGELRVSTADDVSLSAAGDIALQGTDLTAFLDSLPASPSPMPPPVEPPPTEPPPTEPPTVEPPPIERPDTPDSAAALPNDVPNQLSAQLSALSSLSALSETSGADTSAASSSSGASDSVGSAHAAQRTELSSQDATAALAALDGESNQLFSNYFGRDLASTEMSLEDVQALLSNVERESGNRSAVLYVNVPDAETVAAKSKENNSSPDDLLELLLFTAEGAPVKVALPEVGRELLLTTVDRFRSDLATSVRRGGRYYLDPAQQLYEWLLAPVADDLDSAEIDTLIFAMDEGLRTLPVAALHDGNSFLVENYSLGMVPSLGMLGGMLDGRSGGQQGSLDEAEVLAMGVSDFTQHAQFETLPGVPIELEAINRTWPGANFLNEDFTKQSLIEQRQQTPYGIVHLATHAEFKSGSIDNSYIQLWDEKLLLSELSELGWASPAVELLVLSACNTATGSPDAEMGFAGLAIASGVSSAMASLWSVNDLGTLALMNEFYRQLQGAPTKAQALQQAQSALLTGDIRAENGQLTSLFDPENVLPIPPGLSATNARDFAHPYYWSGFTMIGNPW